MPLPPSPDPDERRGGRWCCGGGSLSCSSSSLLVPPCSEERREPALRPPTAACRANFHTVPLPLLLSAGCRPATAVSAAAAALDGGCCELEATWTLPSESSAGLPGAWPLGRLKDARRPLMLLTNPAAPPATGDLEGERAVVDGAAALLLHPPAASLAAAALVAGLLAETAAGAGPLRLNKLCRRLALPPLAATAASSLAPLAAGIASASRTAPTEPASLSPTACLRSAAQAPSEQRRPEAGEAAA
jgi:hypothetical protein